MTDSTGLFQFAKLSIPDKDFGYTLDDNARALILCSWLYQRSPTPEVARLIQLYLTFVKRCQKPNGTFMNYLNFKEKKPTDQNQTEDIEDCQMRAMWSLSEIMTNKKLSENIRAEASRMFCKYLSLHHPLYHLRSKAFAIKAYALVLPVLTDQKNELIARITSYAEDLVNAFTQNSTKDWHWFENHLNYSNALLSESLLIAGDLLKNKNYTKSALISLEFLIGQTFGATYMPIGHQSWYKNNKTRSFYDQQPEDPASMILALKTAYQYTGKDEYKTLAQKCFSWFLGNNSLKVALYDHESGGCFDGLHPDRVNRNQGAESLVSYLMSNVTIRDLN